MVLPNISSPRKWRVIIAVNFPIEAIGRKKPDKNQGFNGIWTCDLRDTGAMLYQLSYEATHWERGQLENLLRWSLFTFIYNRSTNMNHFIQTLHQFTSLPDVLQIYISNTTVLFSQPLRRGYTWRLFWRGLTGPFCQYLGQVSSNTKSLCSLH